MSTTWQILTGGSTLASGTAWEHLNAQGGGGGTTTVQVYQGRRVAAAPLLRVRASLADTVHTSAIRTVTATVQPTTLSTTQTIWKSSQ